MFEGHNYIHLLILLSSRSTEPLLCRRGAKMGCRRSLAIRDYPHGCRGIYHRPFCNIYPYPPPSLCSTITGDTDAIHQEPAKRCRAGHHDHELHRQTASLPSQGHRPVPREGTIRLGKLCSRYKIDQVAMVGRESSETVWRSQQHKAGYGRRGLGKHREENWKDVNVNWVFNSKVVKCINIVSLIPSSVPSYQNNVPVPRITTSRCPKVRRPFSTRSSHVQFQHTFNSRTSSRSPPLSYKSHKCHTFHTHQQVAHTSHNFHTRQQEQGHS